jgi:hypothetical protein
MRVLKQIDKQMSQAPDGQISLTDPDARSMATWARNAIGKDKMTVFADRGYFKGEEILDCERDGIKTLVPKPQTSNNKAAGLFDKADFRYIASKDEYRCPAGQRAIWRFTTVEHGMTPHKYWASACPRCPIKSQCTTGEYRRVARWEHENVLDVMQKRLDHGSDPRTSSW